jgi:AbrB family looped-hinge helix DNA binding protein
MAASEKRNGSSPRAARGARGRVTESGRLSLPAEVRRRVGLEKGGLVRIEVVDGVIQIRTMKDVMEQIRTLARDTGLAEKASVADFLAWRDEECGREASALAKTEP